MLTSDFKKKSRLGHDGLTEFRMGALTDISDLTDLTDLTELNDLTDLESKVKSQHIF